MTKSETTQRHDFVVRLMLLAALNSSAVGICNVTMNIYAVHLGANPTEIGLVGGISGLGIILTVLPTGYLIDQWGARKIYFWGALVGILINAFLPLVKTPSALIAAATITGLFMSFRFVSMNTVFLENLKVIGVAKGGWYRGSMAVGYALLGPLLGAWIIRVLGYTWAFWTAGAFFLAALLVSRLVLPRQGGVRIRTKDALIDTVAQWRGLLKNKNVIEASCAEGLAVASTACFSTFAVAITVRVHHLPQEIGAALVSVQGVLLVLTVFLLGKSLVKLGQRNAYAIGIGALLIGLLSAANAGGVGVWIGAVLIGTGAGILNIINMNRLASTEGKKGRLAGFFTLLTTTGSLLGPVAGGLVANIAGYQAVFWMLVPLFMVLGARLFIQQEKAGEEVYAVA